MTVDCGSKREGSRRRVSAYRPVSLLLAAFFLLPLHSAQAQSVDVAGPESRPDRQLQIVGLKLVPVALVRGAMGPRPKKLSAPWVASAVERIVEMFRQRGYTAARAWGSLKGGRATFFVDEGRIHRTVFVGLDAFRAIVFRVDVDLPERIFHEPTLKRAMQEIKRKYQLDNAYFRLEDSNQMVEGPRGDSVPARLLRIYCITRESFGWGVGVSLNSSWGIVPSVHFAHKGLALEGDRIFSKLAIGFPYHRYLFDATPRFVWVHGNAELEYRFPPFFKKLAPSIGISTSVSRYQRTDLNLDGFHLLLIEPMARIKFDLNKRVSLTYGVGVERIKIFGLSAVMGPNGPLPIDPNLGPQEGREEDDPGPEMTRFVSDVNIHVELGSEVLRDDLRTWIDLDIHFGYTNHNFWALLVKTEGHFVKRIGAHHLILGSKAVFLAGQVGYWEEINLADGYLRVFFANRYWVREAFQLDGAIRFSIYRDRIMAGAFVDAAVFFDRSQPGEPLSLATAFGPGLHFLVFDTLAIDVFYGFGFASTGFDHNFSFSLRTVL